MSKKFDRLAQEVKDNNEFNRQHKDKVAEICQRNYVRHEKDIDKVKEHDVKRQVKYE